jgi:hypothetical protein
VKYNPPLGSLTPQITAYDKLLETSRIEIQRWSDMDEGKIPAIIEAITIRLSDEGKIQFAKMRQLYGRVTAMQVKAHPDAQAKIPPRFIV